nr:ABC transporter ATP-binding protein [Mammaliicoccus sp. Marseille-Q6498]
MNAILEIKDLSINFIHKKTTQKILDDVTLHVKPKQIVSIVGESGSGKSMTAKAIMQLLPKFPKSNVTGEIFYNEKDLLKESDESLQKIRGSKISMIFQDPMSSLNPRLTIGQQIREVLEVHQDISKTDAISKTKDILSKVGIHNVEKRINQYPHEFSGGMRQRVMIAIALISNPDILIADEPTTALDTTIQAQILNLIKALQSEIDTSVIFITHDLSLAYNYSDYIYVMQSGKVIEANDIEQLFHHPQHEYTKKLIDAIPRLNSQKEHKNISNDKILEVKNIYQSFEKNDIATNAVLKDISFNVYKGETLGIIGESGSGKTTLGRAIQGIYKPDFGEILFEGVPIHLMNTKELRILTKDIQTIFQDPMSSLNPRFKIIDILERPFLIHEKSLNREQRIKKIITLLEQVDLNEQFLYRYPHELSGGEKQRIGIARAIALNPKLIICDEAVSALDVSIQKEVITLLKKIQKEYGITLLFIGHDIAVIQDISDRIAVINEGKIAEIANSNEIINQPQHEYTKELLASIPVID